VFSQFQRKWRHRLVDVYLAGTIFVSNAIGVLARVDGQTSTTFGVTRSTEIVRLTRTAYDNFALALYAGRTDRGFSMTWDAGQGVITVLGGTLTLGGGNANNINFASNYLVLGVPGTRIGPNPGASPGQMIIGGAVGSTTGEYATGSVELRGVHAGTNAATNISGGSVVIRSGDGASGSSGAANGGNITLDAGTGYGTGKNGDIVLGGTTGGVIIGPALGYNAALPTIASASTIAPTKPATFISGTAAIATITPPAHIATSGGEITLIPTGLWSTNTSGNIALGTTVVVNKALTLIYDVTTAKWYPSY